MEVPVIDLSKTEGSERSEGMTEIARACQDWGFFQLLNHGISESLLERVKKVSSEIYKIREERFKASLPVQLLEKASKGDESAKEQLRNTDWEDVFTLVDDNEWPSEPADFRDTMAEYRNEIKKLAERMAEIMDENLGLEKGYIKRLFSVSGGKVNPPFFGTKVSHYPPCPEPEMVIGLRAHTDAGGIILLFQDDEVGGLQVLKDGEWIDVQPLRNAIVINTGDQIEVLSNGKYKSAWHRILPTTEGNRLSIASFYNPSLKATISPAPALVTAPNAPDTNAYPQIVFGDYMSVYIDQKFLPKEPRFQAAACR